MKKKVRMSYLALAYAKKIWYEGEDSKAAKDLMDRILAREAEINEELEKAATPKVQRGYVSITRKLEILRKKYAKASRLEKLEEKKKYLASIRSLHATKKKWRLR